MSENAPTCRIRHKGKKYSSIECANHALPKDSEGLCILHFQDPRKDQEAFRAALLQIWNREDSEYHDFGGVFFPGPFNPMVFFGPHEFPKPVNFFLATFTQEANFTLAVFKEGANFSWATFEKKANFYKATFKEEANFSGAIFRRWADFFQATFVKVAIFSFATFKKGANFSEATFEQTAGFPGAKIAGRLVFQNLNPPKEGEPPPPPFRGDFQEFDFQEKGLLRFQDLSLALVNFAGTDLRRPEFHHVDWHDYRGRKALYDEVLLKERELSISKKLANPTGLTIFALEIGAEINKLLAEAPQLPDPPTTDEYAEVEPLYRNLVVNYESENDYKTSGDFHYGEMEMYRRASKWRWFPFYWYNLYWALSGYGERPAQALGWLAGFLLLFPLFIWFFGLNPSPLHSFWETFSYMFEKVTFQKPELKEINDLGKFVSNLGLLIIPGQAALFLLALRNRLGRRR